MKYVTRQRTLVSKSSLLRFAVALLTSLSAINCTRSVPSNKDYLRPVYRFVDPHLRPVAVGEGSSIHDDEGATLSRAASTLSTVSYPVATIGDESRFVIDAPARGSVIRHDGLKVPASGRVSLTPVLVGKLSEAKHLVLVPQFRAHGKWERLPVQLVDAASYGKRNNVVARFLFPPSARGRIIDLNVVGYAVTGAGETRLSTRPLEIPKRALLEFSIGILEPAWPQGAVEFRLRACDLDDCELIYNETLDPTNPETRGWNHRRIELGAFGDTRRRFEFETVHAADAKHFSLPVWASPTIYTRAVRRPEDVNVILLSIDTLRADHLTSYGYRHDTAPFIEERFSKGGTVFEHCVAAATTTTPSHMSIFTSLQPATHGLTTGMEVLGRDILTLTEILRASNVQTGAVTEDGWLGIQHGFGRGFNSYAENKSANIMAPEGQVDVTFGKAASWLRQNYTKHFFLFIHTFQVHDPYAPPERYKNLFAEHDRGKTGAPLAQHLQDLGNYDREIRYTDDELRRLFSTIDQLQLGNNTVFILTSDHGEEFLDHGLLGHGAHMHEENVHVPLMLWGVEVPTEQRVGAVVGHVDFMPTVLEIMGVEWQGITEGTSLLGLINGVSNKASFDGRALFSESRAPIALGANRKKLPFTPPAFSVRVGNRKLARYRKPDGYSWEYYDLAKDPNERVNLHSSVINEIGDLIKLINDYEARHKKLRGRLADMLRQPSRMRLPEKAQLDPQQEEKLRALGYIQ